jgi:cobalt-zinc-cadmium efflux system outer membrane protein
VRVAHLISICVPNSRFGALALASHGGTYISTLWTVGTLRIFQEANQMAALRGKKSQAQFSFVRILCLAAPLFLFGHVLRVFGQEQTGEQIQPASPQEQHALSGTVSSLQYLLTEAEQSSPQILTARQRWQSAKQVPSQVSTLPDPQFMLQQVNVGSPRPFAGFTNSDFAYIGLGVSQDFPYPGKLRLRGEIAERDADVVKQQYESVRRSVLAGVKSAYFQLAYLSKTLGILESDGQLLQQVEQAADARYRSGMGDQQDLLQAQLEQTKLLREITMHHLEVAKAQAQIKQLLNRPQSSPDIETTDLPDTPLPYTFDALLAATKAQNPEMSGAQKMVEKQSLQVDLAHKDFYPDFSVQYMWQRTDPTQFRAYYMLSFGVRVPIYRGRKQRPELAQAEADLSRSRSESEVQSQQVAFELRTEYDTAEKTSELLKIYREGLLPQARAEFDAGIPAYQNNRQDFQPLLLSFLDVLHLDEEYWQDVAERETALARLEELTGLSLREERNEK